MDRLGIPILPHIVNALILTSAFSAGNSTLYCATRSLYGLALEGQAPRLLARCSASGVPYLCVAAVFAISALALLQVNHSAAVVLSWFVSLVTASQLINFCVIAFTYVRFRRACEAQGVRRRLPYRAPFQPYAAWASLVCCLVMTLVGGYSIFVDDNFTVADFLFQYMMVGIFPVIFFGWKVMKGTRFLKPEEVDLVTGVAEIDEYSANYVPDSSSSKLGSILDKAFGG